MINFKPFGKTVVVIRLFFCLCLWPETLFRLLPGLQYICGRRFSGLCATTLRKIVPGHIEKTMFFYFMHCWWKREAFGKQERWNCCFFYIKNRFVYNCTIELYESATENRENTINLQSEKRKTSSRKRMLRFYLYKKGQSVSERKTGREEILPQMPFLWATAYNEPRALLLLLYRESFFRFIVIGIKHSDKL